MRRKINLNLICLSVAVVIAAVICVMLVFYGLFEKQVQSDLHTDAELLRASGIFERDGEYSDIQDRVFEWLEEKSEDRGALRLTWIDEDGSVLYDNDAEASLLENHSDRPEFTQALEEGEAQTRRHSDTMGKNTFYCAILLEDGSVLRLSTDANSIFSIFLSAFPVIILIVVVIILASAFIAHILTGQLLAPINRLAQNIEDTSDVEIYDELVPFVDTIREQHENILSAARSRQDFTANVSHELKTPLTAISGYAQLIENHMADSEQETYIAGKIHESADRLVSLINDIIKLSELDRPAEEQLVFEEIDLYDIAKSRVELLKVNADQKGITITIDGEPTPMRGNRNMIVELIDNLCQNAIQYNNENGKVFVSVGKEEGCPTLTVSDNGIGIPKDMQDRVFERFFRVDKSRSRDTGGTGLGLAIVKHIVELHDARITLNSEPGEGTSIKISF